MDLIAKVGILIVAVIVILGVAFVLTGGGAKQPTGVTQAQAEALVLKDVNQSNPGATINIVNVSSSAIEAGSWNIVFSIIYNSTRACPTLFIEGFDYPATGFVPSTYNQYTDGCTINGLSTAPSYVVSSPVIASIRAYNTSVAYNYVQTYGYNATTVGAKFFPILNSSQLGKSFTNSWLVNFSSTIPSFNQYVVLGQSGLPEGNYTQQK